MCHSENPRALWDDANPILLMLYEWNSKAWMRAHRFATWFTESFKPYYVETFSSEKKYSFQNITAG